MNRSLLNLILLTPLMAAISACSDPVHYDSSLKPKQMTGFGKEIESDGQTLMIPYTPAGELSEFNQLKILAKDASGDFAQLVKDIQVTATPSGSNVRIQTSISLHGWRSNLTFDESIPVSSIAEVEGNLLEGREHGPRTYSKTTWCKTSNCEVVSTIITREDGEKLAFVYSYKQANLSFQLAQGSMVENSDDRAAIQKLMRATRAGKQSVSIVNGISFAQIDVLDPDNSQRYLITVSTPLLSPENDMIRINKVRRDNLGLKRSTQLEVALSGNDPDTGSIWIDFNFDPDERINRVGVLMMVNIGSGDPDELPERRKLTPNLSTIELVERIVVEPLQRFTGGPIEHVDGVLSPWQGSQPRQHSNPVVPLYVLDIKTKDTNNFHSYIEDYRENSHVKRYIRAFTGEEPFKQCGSNRNHPTYKRAKAVSMIQKLSQYGMILGGAANLVDGLPQAAYFIPLESEYLHSGDPNIVTLGSHTSDAGGSKQMLTDTCIDITERNRKTREKLRALEEKYGLSFYCNYTSPLEREYAAKYPNLRGSRSGILKKIRDDIEALPKNQRPAWAKDLKPWHFRNGFRVIKVYYDSIGGLSARSMVAEDSRNNFVESMILSSLYAANEFRAANSTMLGFTYYQGRGRSDRKVRGEWRGSLGAVQNFQNKKGNCQGDDCEELIASTTSRYNVTLMQIDRMKAAKCDHLLYAKSFLALQFIGSNPARYGFGNVRRENKNILAVPGVLPPETPVNVFIGNRAMN